MTESPWAEVGEITVKPTDSVVEVGSFDLVEGADTLWVRMVNTGAPEGWPWSYGILSFKTEEGQPLGSIKAYNSFDGEVFRLGVGLAPSVRSGVLTFEPRGFNLAWVAKGHPWSLKFEAQSGTTGGSVNSYWYRDPVNSVLSPVTPGDDVVLGLGDLSATDGLFSNRVGVGMNPSQEARLVSSGTIGGAGLTVSPTPASLNASAVAKIGSDGQLQIGGSIPDDPKIKLNPNGNGTFKGYVFAENISFFRTDPALYQEGEYLGPQLDLLEEIVRLETLLKHLYETLRIAPPAGWEVWDGNPDAVSSLGRTGSRNA